MNYVAEFKNQPKFHPGEHKNPPMILLAQEGNLDAFNELVLAYQDSVFRQAFWLTGQESLAEDVTQTAFLRAFQKISLFRGGSFRAWLMRIVTNICIDAFRHQKCYKTMSLDPKDHSTGEEKPPQEVVDPGETPEQGVERLEMISTLQMAINQLPFTYRTVLILVDIQDMDYREAAAVLHIPTGTLKSRLVRGRLHLRNALQEVYRLNP